MSEILTPEEFASRLRIGRSTMFEWVRHGILQPGRHYIKVGRILRFIWSDDLVTSLAEATMQPKPSTVRRRAASGKANIDWEY